MITCNGSSLGYGVAGLSPFVKTILQAVRIPRTNQLPAIPADPEVPAISCGPGAK
jgi:hypothetical protein